MPNPTFQLLTILIVVLVGIMAAVLLAVRHANRQVPGLQAWALSYLVGFLLCLDLLARPYTPDALSVLATQGLAFLASWMNLVAARSYTGRKPWPLIYMACGMAIVLGLSLSLIWWQHDIKLRLALACAVSGTLMLLSAQAMFAKDNRLHPERYLFTLACGGHGLLLVAITLALLLGKASLADPQRTWAVAQFVMLECIVVLVMRALGILMLVNAHVTTELRHFAERDPLTSVFNRRSFMILLDKSVNLMQRMNSPLALLVLDLDHFKRLNDTWGHSCGDAVLKAVARSLTATLRANDSVIRWGGEKFLLIFSGCELPQALPLAERCRSGLMRVEHDRVGQVTLSMGVGELQRGETLAQLIERVDQALYAAKHGGRNQVVVSTA